MPEPLSIITGVASLVTVCVKISQSLSTLRDRFQFAQRTISSLAAECSATCMGLSQLQSALQNRPEILNTFGHSREEVEISFDMATWGIAEVFSSLDAELTRLGIELSSGSNSRLGFRRRGRYLWNEERVQGLVQQIREQRSSISFLLQSIQLNQNHSKTALASNPDLKTALQRNYTRAKSLRSQRSNSTLRGAYASDLDSFLEQGDRNESYETTLLLSQPYIQALSSGAQVHNQKGSYNDDGLSITLAEVDTDTFIPVQEELVNGQIRTETRAQLQGEIVTQSQVDLDNRQVRNDNSGKLIVKEPLAIRNKRLEVGSTMYLDSGLVPLPEATPSRLAEKESDVRELRIEASDTTLADVESHEPELVSQGPSLELHKQITDGNIADVEALLEAGVDINCVAELEGDIAKGYSPLGRAIEKNHPELVEILLKHGADLESFAQPKSGYTALHLATSRDRTEIVKSLLQAGSAITKQAVEYCETALCIACRKGLLKMTNLLLEGNGALVLETPNRYGSTPLLDATFHGFTEIAQVLLQAKANLHHKDIKGWTSLHMTGEEGQVGTANLLIKHGAELDATDAEGWTPLHCAVLFRNLEKVSFLLDSGASFDAMSDIGKTALMFAAENNDMTAMTLLLEKGADINLSDVKGWAAIHSAAFHGSFNAVKILLSQKIDPEKTTKVRSTPLMLAAEEGHVEIVKLLLQANVQVNYCEAEDGTALHMAAREGREDVCEVLLEHGALANSEDSRSATPLMLAAIKNHVAVIKLLLDAGAALDIKTKGGATPLYTAADKGHSEVVELLLQRGADVNTRAEDGNSALHCAAGHGHIRTVEVLLDAGATPNIETKIRDTPLLLAAFEGHLQVVELLLQKGANIDAQDIGGLSVLYCAAQRGYTNVVKVLLDAGATLDTKTKKGATSLHNAADEGHREVVELWLQRGADRSLISRGSMNGTPEEVARQKGHEDIADLIKNFKRTSS